MAKFVFQSPGKYIQGAGVLNELGEETAKLAKNPLIISDEMVWSITEERITKSFKDSDIDLLVITERKLSHKQRGEMSALAFGVDIKYQTCISLVIVDEQSWHGPSFFAKLYNFLV